MITKKNKLTTEHPPPFAFVGFSSLQNIWTYFVFFISPLFFIPGGGGGGGAPIPGMKVKIKKRLKDGNTEYCAELREKCKLCPSEISINSSICRRFRSQYKRFLDRCIE